MEAKTMKPLFQRIATMVALASALATTGLAQYDSQAQALRNDLAGQKLLVTYRQGGAVYGTYFFLNVNLCRSGNYVTYGKSKKQSAVSDYVYQTHGWTDQGKWDVAVFAGQLGVRYVSYSGQSNFVPVRVYPNGQIWAGNGTSVVRQGAAQCQ